MRATLFAVVCLALTAAAIPEPKIVCHITGKTDNISYIDPSLCTHLIYGFAEIQNNDVTFLNRSNDLPDNFGTINALRQNSTGLKTLIAVRDANGGSTFSQMAANAASRGQFADNVVTFVKNRNLDGFEIHWLDPTLNGSTPKNMENYIELLKLLRTRFDRESLILTTVVIAPEVFASRAYNISGMVKYFDFVSLLVYRIQDPSERQTVFDAPLRASLADNEAKRTMSVEASVAFWLNQGAPKEKLVIGVPAVGRTFTLQNSEENGVGAATRDKEVMETYTSMWYAGGVLAYNEICELHKNGGWNVVYNEKRKVPYTYKGDQWIGYENVKSAREKAEFIARLNFGGAMVWNIQLDDYEGNCGEKYPLLKTLNAIIRRYGTVPKEAIPAGTTIGPETISGKGSAVKCTRPGNIRDPHSCGFTTCVPCPSGGYDQYQFQCNPGNCYHQTLGRISADNVDINVFVGSQ